MVLWTSFLINREFFKKKKVKRVKKKKVVTVFTANVMTYSNLLHFQRSSKNEGDL